MFKSKSITERDKRSELCFGLFFRQQFSISELLQCITYIESAYIFMYFTIVFQMVIAGSFFNHLYFLLFPTIFCYIIESLFLCFSYFFFFFSFSIISTCEALINELTCTYRYSLQRTQEILFTF